MLVFVVLGPVLELTLLGQSTSQGIMHLPVVIVDQDRSTVSRQIVSAIGNTEDLDVVAHLDSPDQIAAWLDDDRAALAVVLPANLGADLAVRAPQVQLIADGANSISGSLALSAAAGAVNAYIARRTTAAVPDWAFIDLHSEVRYNPTLNLRNVSVGAQLGFIVYQIALMVSALGLARERELGTLEQLLVTPFRRVELLAGKAVPAVIIATIDFMLMSLIVVAIIGVPVRGSFALLLALTLLFIIAQVGWGLIISSMSRTQQQAVLLVFVLVLMDVSFSGYLVPVDRMPPVMQVLSQVFPLQHYLLILRSVMMRGGDLAIVWPQAVALAVLAVGAGAVALVSLHSRLE
jgi:ABC-2 type transport system permease protein